MKLSEAIRLGAMATDRCVGKIKNESGNTCAIGAASTALGLVGGDTDIYCAIARRFNLSNYWGSNRCPVCRSSMSDLWTIIHLNDNHEWTREQIADWIETFEESRSADAVDPVAASQLVPATRV